MRTRIFGAAILCAGMAAGAGIAQQAPAPAAAPSTGVNMNNPEPGSAPDLFNRTCSGCHGTDLGGGRGPVPRRDAGGPRGTPGAGVQR